MVKLISFTKISILILVNGVLKLNENSINKCIIVEIMIHWYSKVTIILRPRKKMLKWQLFWDGKSI